MAIPKQQKPLDVIQQIFNDVLVQTGKALKTANRDGKSINAQATVTSNPKIPISIEMFNDALDELEHDIFRHKAVLQRDLNQLKSSRRPAPEKKPVAPPAPMVVDLESPKAPMAPSTADAPVSPFTTFQSPNRPVKQESKPVAPFPNMGGFDMTVSPKVALSPSPKTIPRSKEPKNSPRTATLAGAAGRASSTTPKKDLKTPGGPAARPPPPVVSQVPLPPTAVQARPVPAARPNILTPVVTQSTTPIPLPVIPMMPTPAPISTTPVPIPVPPSAQAPAPVPTPVPTPTQAPAPIAPMPPAAPENIFTDMTFSLAPPSSAESQNPTQSQTQPPEIDLTALGAGDASGSSMDNTFTITGAGGPADVANMVLGGSGGVHDGDGANMANVDSKIDGLFDFASGDIENMEMDYDLGGDGGDNSNFNDLYFGGDDMGTGEFDNTYFEI